MLMDSHISALSFIPSFLLWLIRAHRISSQLHSRAYAQSRFLCFNRSRLTASQPHRLFPSPHMPLHAIDSKSRLTSKHLRFRNCSRPHLTFCRTLSTLAERPVNIRCSVPPGMRASKLHHNYGFDRFVHSRFQFSSLTSLLHLFTSTHMCPRVFALTRIRAAQIQNLHNSKEKPEHVTVVMRIFASTPSQPAPTEIPALPDIHTRARHHSSPC